MINETIQIYDEKAALLDQKSIDRIIEELRIAIPETFGKQAVSAFLYGSCARGDYNEDSDIDIAVLFDCNRITAQGYISESARLSTDIAMKYLQVVNFVCLPYDEFIEKKEWYPFYSNIEKEGIVIFGQYT